MNVFTYRGGEDKNGRLTLERLEWREGGDVVLDDYIDGKKPKKKKKGNDAPGYLFVGGSGLLFNVPTTPPTVDATGQVLSWGNADIPDNPLDLPIRSGTKLLDRDKFTEKWNQMIEDQTEPLDAKPIGDGPLLWIGK